MGDTLISRDEINKIWGAISETQKQLAVMAEKYRSLTDKYTRLLEKYDGYLENANIEQQHSHNRANNIRVAVIGSLIGTFTTLITYIIANNNF